MNTAAEQYLDLSRNDVVGKNVWDVFPGTAESPRAQVYRRAMAEREPVYLEGSSPQHGWFETNAIPFESGGLGIYFRSATQLKEAEAEALANGRRLRLFLEHAKDYALALLDADEHVREWLGGAEAITGWSSEEVVGKSIDVMFTPEDVAVGRIEDEFALAAKTGYAQDPRWHVRKDGSRFFAEGVTTAFRDDAGRLQGYGKIFRDTTAQRMAEDALRQNREQLQLVLNSAGDGIYSTAADGSCSLMNPAGAAMLGYQPEELVGRAIHDLIHHHHADGSPYPLEECPIAQAAQARAAVSVDDEVFWRKDGVPVSVRYSVNPMLGDDGSISGAVVAFTNITARKQAEAALRESEERLRFVMDCMPQKTFTATPSGEISYFNPPWKEFTGVALAEILSWGWTRLIHPDDLEESLQVWKGSAQTGEPFQMEHRLRDSDGHYHWHLSRSLPMRDDAGQVLMWVGSTTDIQDLKTAEFELGEKLRSEQRHAALLTDLAAASRAMNAVLSVEAIIKILAEQAREILGAHQAIVSLTAGNLSSLDTASLPDNHGDDWAAQSGEEFNVYKEQGAAGEQSAPALSGGLTVPLVGLGDKGLGTVQVFDKGQGEFSEEDEVILAQLAAIAAVGIQNASLYDSLREQDQRKNEFLATLAHELRNPLAPLRTGLDLLRFSESDERTLKVRGMMERQLDHMVRLVDDLMDVSRVSRGKVELKRSPIPLRTVVDTAVEATASLIEAANHKLVMAVPDDAIYVNGDLTRLAQVLNNLLNNAAKYTPSGGTIELSAELEENWIVIRVADNGVGLSKRMLPKVFDLFTQAGPSLNEFQSGLGIGLSLVKKLVEMHGGSVMAESEGIGKGSTFTVKLPTAQESARWSEPSAEPGNTTEPPGRRILVVDDNIDAAEALAMLLELGGHQVRVAHNGAGAKKVAHDFLPDAAFLDLGLPDFSGHEVATAMREDAELKDIVLIAVTGWGSEEDRRRSRAAGFDLHLTKPVSASAVSAALERFFPDEPLSCEPAS